MEKILENDLFVISISKKLWWLRFKHEGANFTTFEFTRASAVYRSRFSTTIGLCSQALLDFGTDKQKDKYLPLMASGKTVGSFALTEPNAGSDALSLETSAKKDGEEYIINGTKKYITNAPYADVFLVMAKTNPDIDGSKGISSFLVDSNLSGIEIGETPKMLGQKGSVSPEVYFKNCRVNKDALLGEMEGGGLKPALRGINHARLHVAGTCVGQAKRLIKESILFANNRIQFNKPISQMASVQNLISDSYSEMLAAEALTLSAAKKFDEGKFPKLKYHQQNISF
jgi:Acyl-CoA dehydrogenases